MEHEQGDLKTYKILETRLYGELMKTCRRYSNQLSLISVLGILDIVKQEMKDLDRTNRSLIEEHAEPSTQGHQGMEKGDLDTLA